MLKYQKNNMYERVKIMSQTILYYPYINIKNEQWIRNALLYWDNISSIVPHTHYDELSPELLYLKEKEIYTPIYPKDLFDSDFSNEFKKSFIRKLEHYEESIESKDTIIRKKTIKSPELSNWIHQAKIPSDLYKFLNDKKYINNLADGWLELDDKIINIYMRTLAEYCIKTSENDMVLGTSNKPNQNEIFEQNHKDIKSTCCELKLIDCFPQPLIDTSLDDIIKFKIQRKDELEAFKEKIKELENNIYRANSIEEIKHHETNFVENWKSCKKDYYKVLREAKIKCVLGNLSTLIALPFVKDALNAIGLDPLAEYIQNGVGLLNVVFNSINYTNIVNSKKYDSGFAYIIEASKDELIKL